MFKAFLNGTLFFDSSISLDELALTNAKLSLEVGKAGSFNFTLYPSNLMYDEFHKFTSYVDVYKKDRLIFSGRVLDISKGFYNQQEIICEGLLSVFNDTVARPFTHSGTLEALLITLLNNHNNQVAADKQVSLGNVTVKDSNDYVGRTYEAYVTTMKRLDDLATALGGYFVVRKTDSGLVLDYLEDFTEYSGQEINFGENLLDLKRESTGADMITALIPLGAADEETQEKLTIKSVNNGLDYLVNQVAVDEYGWIMGTQEWTDVTSPAILMSKGMDYLADRSKSRITINVSAVDMAKANSDIAGFFCCQYIKVKSSLHGIDEYLLAVKQDLDLLNPANNKMSLGTTRLGFIDQSSKIESNLVNIAKKAEAAANVASKKTVRLQTKIEQNAEAIKSTASQVTTMGETVQTAQSIAEQTATKLGWIIESGTSESNFTLTDRVATLMASKIDITGLTEFMDAAKNGTSTVINGGAIKTGTIAAEAVSAGSFYITGGSFIIDNATAGYSYISISGPWNYDTYTARVDSSGFMSDSSSGVSTRMMPDSFSIFNNGHKIGSFYYWDTGDMSALMVGEVDAYSDVSVQGNSIANIFGWSSKEIKKDIEPLGTNPELDAQKLYDLPVIQFKYKDDFRPKMTWRHNIDLAGFLIEDLEEIYPIAVEAEDNKRTKRQREAGEDVKIAPKWWNPNFLIPPMLKLIQEQKNLIDNLSERVERIETNGTEA